MSARYKNHHYFSNKPVKKSLNRGIAIIEFMIMIMIFIFTIVALYGTWGVIHSGILNSIGARTYAMRIINNRADLKFVSDFHTGEEILTHNYYNTGMRFFTTIAGGGLEKKFLSIKRRVDIGGAAWTDVNQSGLLGLGANRMDEDLWEDLRPEQRNTSLETSVVRLKQGYGICLNAGCNDQ